MHLAMPPSYHHPPPLRITRELDALEDADGEDSAALLRVARGVAHLDWRRRPHEDARVERRRCGGGLSRWRDWRERGELAHKLIAIRPGSLGEASGGDLRAHLV